jgi:hypothetical protein
MSAEKGEMRALWDAFKAIFRPPEEEQKEEEQAVPPPDCKGLVAAELISEPAIMARLVAADTINKQLYPRLCANLGMKLLGPDPDFSTESEDGPEVPELIVADMVIAIRRFARGEGGAHMTERYLYSRVAPHFIPALLPEGPMRRCALDAWTRARHVCEAEADEWWNKHRRKG